HNIYGVDLDPKAIDITAFTLMVQVYDELKEGARCPTMIGENLKVGNSLVSAITPEGRNGFISRKELEEKFKDEIAEIIRLREIEKGIDNLDDFDLRKLIEENFDEVVEIYGLIKEKYPNAIPTAQQKLLDEWHKRARNEPIDKTFDVLITQTGLARIFLKEVFFEKIRKLKERIEFEINRPLIKYFNSEKRVLKDKELKKILKDERKIEEELRFVKDKATEISKSQPPKAFNWEIEFPEVFFDEDGTLKENPGFDCVVGNPPHLIPEDNSLRTFISIYSPKTCRQFKHTALAFIEISSHLSRMKGLLGLITPKLLTYVDKWEGGRELLLKDNQLYKVVDISKAFPEVTIEQVIIIFKKGGKTDTYLGLSIQDEHEIIQGNFTSAMTDQIGCLLIYPSKHELQIFNKIHQLELFKINRSFEGISGVRKFFKRNPSQGVPIIIGKDIGRYFLNTPSWYLPQKIIVDKDGKLKKKPALILKEAIVCQNLVDNVMALDRIIIKAHYKPAGLLAFNTVQVILIEEEYDKKFILGLLNSQLFSWYAYVFIYNKSLYSHLHLDSYYVGKLPIRVCDKLKQAPIISLVDAIIEKKKEYHAISQNIEDYIDFKKANLIRLDEFLKFALDDFEVVSSLKAKRDNFDALRLRIEGDRAIVEYGIRRKAEDYEEIEEDEQTEVRGKYVVEWHLAGEGKIKDKLAVEFLAKMIEKEKRFSKAKS
ncbi:MAG: hypothetical protein DRP09_21115, partial [Candidatus Thorarchaeota archaeon]